MKTSVNLAGVELKNPVMTASGTFGSGAEYSEFVDLKELGAVVTKGVANVPWPGNPTPRIAEVYGGMLNAIGLQNPGIDVFCERDIPFLKQFDTKIVVNVCGRTTEDYCEVVERLTSEPVDLLEINISCPNVKEGGIAFGQDPKAVEAITREVKKYAKQPIIMKLSPNVTDITEMARAAEAGGADVLSLINTLTGMKIDIERQKFAIANKTGGMSGPAVKPIAVRMVYQVAQAVKVPIIGMGGIASAEDALDYLLKPVSYPEFLKAANKALNWFEKTRETQGDSLEEDCIFVKSDYKLVKVELAKICYIEGLKDYVKIYLEGVTSPIVSLISMKSLEEMLPASFCRVHRSFIVNLNRITVIERNRIVFGKTYIPIADSSKDKFMEFLNKRTIK